MARLGDVDEVSTEIIKATVNKSVKNTHEVSDYNNFGVDSKPQKGAKVVLLSLREKAHKIMVGVKRLLTQQIAKPGETRLYSAFGSQVYLNEDGEIVIETASGAIMTMKDDATIEINGSAKSAMTFEDFESVWNAYIIKYEAHVHLDPVSGSTGAPTIPLVAGEKDMTPAKSLIVKLGANP